MITLETLGFVGAIVVAVAYVPQITHLIAKHCAYGISVKAWLLWLVASFLIIPHALTSNDSVFALLQIINLIAIFFILTFSYFHQRRLCKEHKIL